MRYFGLSILFFGMLFAQPQTERTIQLKSGDKVTGTTVSENDSLLVLKTSFGEITILKSNIKQQVITLYLKDGNVLSGEVVSSSDSSVVLTSAFGPITIAKNNIDRTSDAGVILPGTQKEKEFYYSDERLIDVFFDPTGYTMEKGSIYFSGLSWGVALSENIDVSSSYWRYFLSDMNIRPKFRIYKGGNIESEQAFSLGFHLHTAGHTGKQKLSAIPNPGYVFPGNSVEPTYNQWTDIGKPDETRLWTEVFTAYTVSNLKEDKQGRISYHGGLSVILHPDETMPRFWIAMDNDITSKFKILAQVYYDAYQPSYRETIDNKKKATPFDIDFGFVYAFDENLRFGIHFQPYVILFYFKF